MTEVHQNRRFTGWFLLAFTAFLVAMLLVSITQHVPWWAVLWVAPVLAGFGWLAWIYIINQPVLRLGNGWFEIVRKPFPALRIPLDQINSVRIRQLGAGGGSLYFLEVALNRVTPEIQGLLNTTTKRQTVKVCQQFADYEPPAEPFLILVVPLLGISDAELVTILAREQKSAQTVPCKATAFGNHASNPTTPGS